jgi:hypothetical protein
VNSQVQDISAALGRGGYEGIQDDSTGQLWVVEDVGGATVPGDKARIPHSFAYRFVPAAPRDLTRGKLQALQVFSDTTHTPITFQPIDRAHPQGNAFSADQKTLHTFVWQKFSRSGGGGECVEVAYLADGGRTVRDSKDPAGPALRFIPAEWAAFTAEVRDGEFD